MKNFYLCIVVVCVIAVNFTLRAQNVGISDNLFTPQSLLHVYRTSDGNVAQFSRSDLANTGIVFSVSGSNWTMRNWQNGELRLQTGNSFMSFYTNAGERMRISDAGNVGIGTTGPTARFHVDGTVRFQNLTTPSVFTTALVIDVNGNVQARTLDAVAFDGYTETDPNAWLLLGNNNATPPGDAIGTPITGGNFLGTTNAQHVVFATNNYERMRISSTAGNHIRVGIGTAFATPYPTTNTTTLLHLFDGGNTATDFGQLQLGAAKTTAGNKVGEIAFHSTVATSDRRIAVIESWVTDVVAGPNQSGDLRFFTNNNNPTVEERMRLDAGGNLGINTTAPTARLHVDGTVRFENLTAPSVFTTALVIDVNGNVQARTLNTVAFDGEIDPNAWLILGNTNIIDGTHFVGTQNNVPLNFRVNNTASGRISSGGQTIFGYRAGLNNTATHITAVGYLALINNTSGIYNTALGQSALADNTTGGRNIAIGDGALQANVGRSYSVAVGYNAMRFACSDATGGAYNTAVGNSALAGSTVPVQNTGIYNSAFGNSALASNSSGSYNVAIGGGSLYHNTANSQSTAIGYQAMYNANSTTAGNSTNNTAVGYQALMGSATHADNTGRYNTAVGSGSLYGNTTGHRNTAIGCQSLMINLTGYWNVATGYQALASNTTGYGNAAFGYMSLQGNTSGNYNTAVGTQALYYNTSGASNTAMGRSALTSNRANSRSTAIGFEALYWADSRVVDARETYNTAIGYQALYGSTTASSNTGRWNTAVGDQALYSNTSGNYNTATGYLAMNSNTIGAFNSAFGCEALMYNVSGTYNTAVGWYALRQNTVSGNTGIGNQSLSQNTIGAGNTAVGDASLSQNTTGQHNVAMGTRALSTNVGMSQSTAIGYEAMRYANNAAAGNTFNTALGYQALRGSTTASNNTGIHNTVVGYQSLMSNTSGQSNTTLGSYTLNANTTGSFNVAVGREALFTTNCEYTTAVGFQAGGNNPAVTAGNYSTFIGNNARPNSSGLTNASAIGNGAQVYASNNMVFGNNAVVGWGFGVSPGAAAIRVGTNATNGNNATLTLAGAWTNGSDSTRKCNIRDSKYGLNEVLMLRPVDFVWKGTDISDFGFIAQEVKVIIPEIVHGEEGEMTVAYSSMVTVLTKAIQEQQDMIETLQNENKSYETQINLLLEQNNVLQSQMNDIQQQILELQQNDVFTQK